MKVWRNKRFLFLTVFIFIGVLRGIAWKPPALHDYFDHPYDICGTVGFPSGVLETLLIDHTEVKGRLQMIAKGYRPLRVGQRVCFKTSIQRVKNFGTPGEFDLERLVASQNILGKVFLSPKIHLHILPQKAFYPIQMLRERFLIFLDLYSQGGILKALILGEKEGLSKTLQEDFIKSGLIHLLVVSGQNVSLLLLLFSSLLGVFLFRSEKLLLHWNVQKILVVMHVIVIGFFYIFSGGAIPILRASLMALSLSISLWYSKPSHGFYSLCWSLALILHFFPWSLLDPSFQLSFAATSGLLIFMTLWPHKNFWELWVMTPLVAFGVTAPLILYHFYRLSLISLASNLWGVPYVTFLLLPLAFVISISFFIYLPLAKALMILFEPLARFFVWAVQWFSSWSWASFYLPSPTVFEIFLYYGFLILIFYTLWRRNFFKAFWMTAVGMSLLSVVFYIPIYVKHRDSHLKVSFLSVGQGDASWVELPYGKTLLIDGGGLWGSFDIGERVVAPYLWRKRIRAIDVLILSHSDFDHSGGLAFILKHFNVGQIWLSQWQAPTKTFYTLLALAEEKKIPCYMLSEQTRLLHLGEVTFHFLNPKDSFLNARTNNLSLVFKMTYKNFSILFTGDIEKEIENHLLLKDIQSTILKVPHHGSKTSSSDAFLRKVSPSLAVMSLGTHNRYHFPHEQVLKRYEDLRIPIWRTDEKGTLQIQTDGKIWMFKF